MIRWLLEPLFRHVFERGVDGLAERSRAFSLLVDAVAVVVVLVTGQRAGTSEVDCETGIFAIHC